MKIDKLDAHDRLLHLNKTQSQNIDECCQDLIQKRPFGPHPFYIFVHARTDDNGADKRLIWQDRLGKPQAQTNSMLFKAYPDSNGVDIVWILPPREMFSQYKIGLLTASKVVTESIKLFENDREALERPAEDDPSPERMQELLFEYKPWLFRRDTLPADKKTAWDVAMSQKMSQNVVKETPSSFPLQTPPSMLIPS